MAFVRDIDVHRINFPIYTSSFAVSNASFARRRLEQRTEQNALWFKGAFLQIIYNALLFNKAGKIFNYAKNVHKQGLRAFESGAWLESEYEGMIKKLAEEAQMREEKVGSCEERGEEPERRV